MLFNTGAALLDAIVLITLVVTGIISMFTHPFVGMCLIGAGLICGGVRLLFLMLTVAMAGIITPGSLSLDRRIIPEKR